MASGGAGAVGAQAAGAPFPRPTCPVSRPLLRPQRQLDSGCRSDPPPLPDSRGRELGQCPPQHCPTGLRSEGSCRHSAKLMPAGFPPSQPSPASGWDHLPPLLALLRSPALGQHWSHPLGLSTGPSLGPLRCSRSPEPWGLLPTPAHPAGPSHGCVLGLPGRQLKTPPSETPEQVPLPGVSILCTELDAPSATPALRFLSCLSPPGPPVGGRLTPQLSTKWPQPPGAGPCPAAHE